MRSREGTEGALCISEAEGLGRHHLWAGRGKPWGPKLRVDPVEQLCFSANWGKPQAKKQQLNPFFFWGKDDSFPNWSGEWLVRGRRAQQLGELAVSRRKSFSGEDSWISEHASMGEKEVLQKRCSWCLCEIYVGHWRAMPSRGSKPKTLMPKLWEAGRENHL